jgi:hypothetical protein
MIAPGNGEIKLCQFLFKRLLLIKDEESRCIFHSPWIFFLIGGYHKKNILCPYPL